MMMASRGYMPYADDEYMDVYERVEFPVEGEKEYEYRNIWK